MSNTIGDNLPRAGSAATVMIVGHDRNVGVRLAESIRQSTGLQGTFIPDAAGARTLCQSGREVALAIVHAGLPGDESHVLCADLVQAHRGLPVMMVSDQYSEAEAVRSLSAGAIDYFPRLHQRAELLARLRAHLRSKSTSLDVDLTIGSFSFHPGQRVLVDRRKHTRIWLTAKESRILRRLHLANSQPVPTEELLQVAWGSPDASVHTLQTHIYRLRCKLAASGDRPMLLTTPRGYLLDL